MGIIELDEAGNAGNRAKIKVVGVGGAGGNTLNHMAESGMEGVEFIAIIFTVICNIGYSTTYCAMSRSCTLHVAYTLHGCARSTPVTSSVAQGPRPC